MAYVIPAAGEEDTILTQSTNLADRPVPLEARAGGPLTGTVRVPGHMSISQRALILGALAVGRNPDFRPARGPGCPEYREGAMRALGARVERTGDFAWKVTGVGVAGVRRAGKPRSISATPAPAPGW